MASFLICCGIVVAAVAGLASGNGGPTGDSSVVLMSHGADLANLGVVVPLVLASLWWARRGSLTGLLLWPGALFYVLYAYMPYLVGARFSWLFFVHAGLVTLSAFTVIGIVARIHAARLARPWTVRAARGVGAALILIALSAFAGLTATALDALDDPAAEAALRPLAVADWAVGTPALLAGGVLLWLRAPLGYVVAPGLLLVTGLGGAAFDVAAVVDNLGDGPQTEAAVVVVHAAISLISLVLLGYSLRQRRQD